MATVVPPRSAKRARLAQTAAEKAAQTLAANNVHGPASSTVVVQLTSSPTVEAPHGQPLGPPISLPAGQTGQSQLQQIVNQLMRLKKEEEGRRPVGEGDEDDDDDEEDDDDTEKPYSFHVLLRNDDHDPSSSNKGSTRLTVTDSILSSVLAQPASQKLGLSTESILSVVFEPQAVFRVRTVSRCTSTLSGHGSPILCASFSPTGNLLVTGAGDHTARLWDAETETPMHTLTGHKGWVLCAEWEGRERRLATGDMEGEVRVWDALDARGGRTGKAAWGAKTGQQVDEEEMAKRVAEGEPEGGEAGGKIKMKAQARRALRHAAPTSRLLKGHTKWVTSIAWEPIHLVAPGSHPRLASSSKDGTVRVWESQTGRCLLTLGGHTASVNVVRWGGGDGKQGALYTASSDRTVKIWNAADGRLIRSLDAHAHWVNTLALSTDTILRTGPFDHTFKPRSALATESEYPQDDAAERARDVEAQQIAMKRFQAVTSDQGRAELVVSGSEDHTLFLWPAQIGTAPASVDASSAPSPKKPLARLTGHQKSVSHVAFSPDGTLLASAGFDNSVRLWDARRNGRYLTTLRGHVGAVYRLAWSADSRALVSASKDSTLKIWDARTFRLRRDLPGHEDEVYCVEWRADKVASGGRDRAVKLWRH